MVEEGQGQVEVVDLQALNLNQIEKKCENLSIGATTTLQQMIDYSGTPMKLRESLLFEGTHHLRQVATVGGTVISAKGDSLFAGMLLACNAEMHWEPQSQLISFEKWLTETKSWLQRKLLVEVTMFSEPILEYEKISLTPQSKPELFVTKAIVGEKRRYVLGGKCSSFHLFDGTISGSPKKLSEFLDNAYSDFSQSKMTITYFKSAITT